MENKLCCEKRKYKSLTYHSLVSEEEVARCKMLALVFNSRLINGLKFLEGKRSADVLDNLLDNIREDVALICLL